MPIATRRQAHAQAQDQRVTEAVVEVPSDELVSEGGEEDVAVADDEAVGGDGDEEGEGEGEDEEDDEIEEDDGADLEPEPFPPPGLKEISSLASWTVSSAKPGNGVAALRSSDLALFWQSDGPQPHLLSIHFFKLVSIVHMRIYLDFENDESYTPTKIEFLAGMGAHDTQEFAEMSFEQPTGWINVDFSRVGPVEPAAGQGDGGDNEDDDDDDDEREVDWSRRPVLRAFLVQVKILENHQNGKDTHLRAVQLFARDETYQHPRKATTPKSANTPTTTTKTTLPMRAGAGSAGAQPRSRPNNIKLAPWMMDPDLR